MLSLTPSSLTPCLACCCSDWKLDDFINTTLWDECGGLPGIHQLGKQHLIEVVAVIDGVDLNDGQVYTYTKGKLSAAAASANANEGVGSARKSKKMKVDPNFFQTPSEKGGGIKDADVDRVGDFESYERCLKYIDETFITENPQSTIKMMLGGENDSFERLGGEPGGKIFAAYLISLEKVDTHAAWVNDDDEVPTFLRHGTTTFLESLQGKAKVKVPLAYAPSLALSPHSIPTPLAHTSSPTLVGFCDCQRDGEACLEEGWCIQPRG